MTILHIEKQRQGAALIFLVLLSLAVAALWEGCGPRPSGGRLSVRNLPADSARAGAAAGTGFAAEHAGTGFPLLGRHAEIPCESCHGEKQPEPNCRSCHRSPHDAKLKIKCESCHTAGLPFSNVTFDHPAEELLALHRGIACTECHREKKFLEADRSCASCHDDFHKGSLGTDCYECHRFASWAMVDFNHNRTGFPLMGAHRALECGDCHRDVQSFRIVPRPTDCASCHESDYRNAPFAHATYGAGTNCQECHLQDSFNYAHSPAWFNIQTGRHAGISCDTCHMNSRDYREYSCHACHRGHEDDNGGRCLDCHSGSSFGGGGDDD